MSLSRPLDKDANLYLIDGSAYLFRAYHALPPLTRKSDGLPVGAVSGFCNMLWKLMRDSLDAPESGHRATHMAVIFDAKGPTFRKDIYDAYKANRPPPPEDLVPQFPLVRDASIAFGLPSIELEGYEADDIIAAYARHCEGLGAKCTIVSSDKDLMQLVSDTTCMYDPMKDKRLERPEVIEKFGVGPERVTHVQALAGDSVDNIPGVPGIGVKTAAQLIEEYGDLETLLERAGEIKQNKRRENLIEYADLARISYKLVLLDENTPLSEDAGGFGLVEPEVTGLLDFLEEMEFRTLPRRVRETFQSLGLEVPEEPSEEEVATAINVEAFETVSNLKALQKWIDRAEAQGFIAFDTETTGLDTQRAELVGISLATAPNEACYIPLAHISSPEGELALEPARLPDQMSVEEACSALKPLFENPAILKIAQNVKYDLAVLRRYGVEVISYDDTMLLSFVMNAGNHGAGMDELSERYLEHSPISFKELAGTGKKQKTFAEIDIESATKYAAEDADVTLRLWKLFRSEVHKAGVERVYQRLERPLPAIVAGMEAHGVKVDGQMLSRLSSDFAQGMARLEAEAYEVAGHDFNLGSPKQISEILFVEMALPGGKKTKTGAWSTDVRVLEDLAASGHELPRTILNWRTLQKLKSTYTDALKEAINPETGRVHTSYSLTGASTGRFASNDPNLQNIPIRTEEGRKIREAFIAEPGHKLISADYSQIELRLLAHIADIGPLKDAFHEGLDIHAMTASEMFGEPIEGMDPMTRRKAKAINFGIIYGISAFGLANQLSIGRAEAKDYIDQYFEKFPGIRAYMDETKRFARDNGYVKTIMGRKIWVRGINDKNGAHRGFAERQAINAPIQGSAADVIKRAMIKMPKAIQKAGLDAKMLLQVHDELIFEVPEEEAEATCDLVINTMRDAPFPALDLSIPLVVEAESGDSWAEVH